MFTKESLFVKNQNPSSSAFTLPSFTSGTIITPPQNLWLYTDINSQKPDYNRSQDYVKECQKFTNIKGNLENILSDFILVNNFLRDEFITAEQKYQWSLAIEKSINHNEEIHNQLKKKRRKIIMREFKCEFDGCNKEYCSIDALALHVKRKHPEDFNSFGLNRKRIKRSIADKVKEDIGSYTFISNSQSKTKEESYVKEQSYFKDENEVSVCCKSSKSTSLLSLSNGNNSNDTGSSFLISNFGQGIEGNGYGFGGNMCEMNISDFLSRNQMNQTIDKVLAENN